VRRLYRWKNRDYLSARIRGRTSEEVGRNKNRGRKIPHGQKGEGKWEASVRVKKGKVTTHRWDKKVGGQREGQTLTSIEGGRKGVEIGGGHVKIVYRSGKGPAHKVSRRKSTVTKEMNL